MTKSRLRLTLPYILLLMGCAPQASPALPTPAASATSRQLPTAPVETVEIPVTQPQPTETPTGIATNPTAPPNPIDTSAPPDLIDPRALPPADLITAENAHSLIRLGQIPGTLDYSPDMRHATWKMDGKLEIISLEEPLTIAEIPEYSVVSFSPDGSRVAWATGTGTVIVRDLAQPRPDIVLENISPYCCFNLTFSSDPRYLLVPDEQPDEQFGVKRVIRIWDLDQNDAPATWAEYDWGNFSPTGAQIGFKLAGVVGASLWDVGRLVEVGSVEGFELSGPEYGLLFSPDWNSAAFWSRTSGEIYGLSTGKYRFSFNGQARRFSPDGRLLATAEVGWVVGECSSAVCLYDAYSGALMTILAHGSTADILEFSPDGSLLATVAGGKLHLWDVASGAEIPGIQSNARATVGVGFSPDGRYLLANGIARDGSGDIVEFWAVDPEP